MPIDITMPRLSDTMEQGTIVKWHVAQGDTVESGDVLADVETDKATMEMQAYDDGTITSIAVPEGKPVEIGTVVAVMAEEGEDTEAQAAPAADPEPVVQDAPAAEEAPAAPVDPPAPASTPPPTPSAASSKTRAGHVRISPVARRLAEEHGVDITTLHGSGPMGRIVKRDVLSAVGAAEETTASIPPSATPVAAPTPPPAAVVQATPVSRVDAPEPTELAVSSGFGLQSRSEPVSNMRQVIASRLVESKQTIPHYQVSMVFDMDPMVEMRTTLNDQLKSHGVKLTFNDLILRCCALAMYTNPLMNASWGGDHIEYHGDVNIGVAVSLPPERGGGLVVASIRNADRKSLRAISQETHALVDKARTKGLTVDEMSDSTFTISNLGMYGVDNFTAIINPPNSAILALGAIQKKPVVRDGQVVVGHEMSVTLSNDHRVVDGATAAEYLVTLKDLIENPGMALV